MPIFAPLLRESQSRGVIDAAVTDPPWGRLNNFTKLSAVESATNTTASAIIRVRDLNSVIFLRQHYLGQVQRVEGLHPSSQPGHSPAPLSEYTEKAVNYIIVTLSSKHAGPRKKKEGFGDY